MESQRTILLLLGLGASVLYVLSRTKPGQDVAQGAVEFVDVSASRIKNALTSRGYRNNNPGNIRFIAKNPWNGQVADDGGYGVYDTPQNGTRALGRQLLVYARRGLVTVRDIIATWAPSIENNTTAYIAHMSAQLNVAPDDVLDVRARLADLARAIARHENGYLDSSYDWQWVYL